MRPGAINPEFVNFQHRSIRQWLFMSFLGCRQDSALRGWSEDECGMMCGIADGATGGSMNKRHQMCRCGHDQQVHRHYRRGTDCSLCGPVNCPRFKSAYRLSFLHRCWWRTREQD